MKHNLQRYHLVTFLLSIIVVMAGCIELTRFLDKPVITKHPASQTLNEGGTASLSVEATAPEGATLSYQWQQAAKGSTSFTDVRDARSATYTTPSLVPVDSGSQYRVVVTATNTAKHMSSVTSDTATLSVLTFRKIAWTHVNGTKRYADIPTDGVLVSAVLTATKTDIQSVDTIPSSIVRIGDEAFLGCTSLVGIRIPSSVSGIGRRAFSGASGLTSVRIPSSVSSVETSTFYKCTALTSVTIAEGVISIGSSAFQGCTALASVTLPSSVSSIGSYAFQGCTALAGVTLPSGLTSISSNAFSGAGLTSITLPSSVSSIGEGAFSDCAGLLNVRVERTTPPSAELDIFYGTHPSLSIRVPSTSVAAYKGSTNWSKYSTRITGY